MDHPSSTQARRVQGGDEHQDRALGAPPDDAAGRPHPEQAISCRPAMMTKVVGASVALRPGCEPAQDASGRGLSSAGGTGNCASSTALAIQLHGVARVPSARSFTVHPEDHRARPQGETDVTDQPVCQGCHAAGRRPQRHRHRFNSRSAVAFSNEPRPTTADVAVVGAACCAEQQPQLLHDRTTGRGARSAAADRGQPRPPRSPRGRLSRLDEFAYRKSFLVSVGDEKGRSARRRRSPRRSAAGPGTGHLLRLRGAAASPNRRRRPRRWCPSSSCRRRTPRWHAGSGITPASATGSSRGRDDRRRRPHPGPVA